MNFLHHLTHDLNIWCISVEEEAGDIDIPSMSTLIFELYRRTLDKPHMSLSETLYPGTPAPIPPLIHAPRANNLPAPTQTCAPRGDRSRWTPPSGHLLPSEIGLRTCITACMGSGQTLPVPNKGSVMCLAWPLCGSCSINCINNRDHRAHHHVFVSECQCALELRNHWCQARTAPMSATQKYCTLTHPTPTYQALLVPTYECPPVPY